VRADLYFYEANPARLASPKSKRAVMTTTTIIQIILGLLLAFIIKKFYYFILNIKIEIEKENKEKEKKIDKNHWLIENQKHLEETFKYIESKIGGEKDYYDTGILILIKKLSHFLDKEDRWGKEFHFFNILISCYFINYQKEKDQFKDLLHEVDGMKLAFEKREEQLKLEKIGLEQKQQELELREAKIIKIESAQKILNSELVEKINKEID
jgi:hypothetical protein